MAQKHARLGNFRVFGIERAKLEIFRGFGALLIKILKSSLKMGTYLPKGFFKKVLNENPKIALPAVILKKKNPDPQLHQIFKPIRAFFCTFLPI